ncbi:Peptidase S8/S53 domain containing protein [Rhypophila sp. PSN 637]
MQDPEASPGVAAKAIEINSNVIEPESQMAGGDMFEETASHSNYILIQFTALPTPEQEDQLEDLQVEFCRKIPPTTWLAKFTPHDLSALRDLPYVLYANPYHESLSLKPALERMLARGRQGFAASVAGPSTAAVQAGHGDLVEVAISLHPSSRTPDEFRSYLAASYAVPVQKIHINLTSVTACLNTEQIVRVSKIDDVAEVHLLPKLVAHSHLVGAAVRTQDAALTASISYPDLNLDGDGEIIAITDSGLDLGRTVRGWFELEDPTHPFFRERVVFLECRSNQKGTLRDGSEYTRQQKPHDFVGHGTHVAGIALGSYGGMKAQAAIGLQGLRLDGVAPKAGLIMQNIYGVPVWDLATQKLLSAGKPDVDGKDLRYHTLFLDAYFGFPSGGFETDPKRYMNIAPKGSPRLQKTALPGARIHNCSWGQDMEATGGYEPFGPVVNETVYLVPDYLIIFGAGNDGDDKDAIKLAPDPSGQILGFAAAKNVLTVGACFNHSQYIKNKPDPGEAATRPNPRLWSSYQDGGQQVPSSNVSRMSSRGPPRGFPTATAALIKPDVVAPGIAIYSAQSRAELRNPGFGEAPVPNELCTFKSGSSMAAPVVAGAAALIRQALKKRGGTCADPSAALMKALIVQGALDLSTKAGMLWQGNTDAAGGSNVTNPVRIPPAPNNIQGWGRLNIAESVHHAVDTTYCVIHDVKAPSSSSSSSSSSPVVDPRLQPPSDAHAYDVRISPPSDDLSGRFTKGHVKATLCWTDIPAETLQNQLALSITYVDGRAGSVSVDPDRTGTNRLYQRMAWNNVQRLEIKDIPSTAGPVDLRIRVDVVNLVIDPITKKKEPQAYALVYKVWYTI